MYETIDPSVRATPQEQAQWLIARLNPQDIRYNIGLAIAVYAPLQHQALGFAWQRLLAAHPILRTRYSGCDDLAIPATVQLGGCELDVQALGGSDELEKQQHVQRWFDRPFDIAKGDVVRLGCFQDPEGWSVLVLSAHHIVADFTSLGLMFDELESLYLVEVEEESSGWRVAGLPFSDYRCEVQEQAVESGDQVQAEWHRYLQPVPTPLRWASHWAEGARAGASHYLTIEGTRLQGLRALASRTNASLYTVMLVSWAQAVSDITHEDEVVIGMPMSMRDDRYAQTLGSLFNVLPQRVRSSSALSERIQRARGDLHRALGLRSFDLSQALGALPIARPHGRNPLFQTTVNMLGQTLQSRWLALHMAAPDARQRWAGLDVGPWRLNQQQGQVDIALEFIDAIDALRVVIKGDDRIFSTTGLVRFTEHWLACVDGIVGETFQGRSLQPMDIDQDCNRVPGPINAVPCTHVSFESLVSWFDSRCQDHPDSPALREGAHTLDWRALQRCSLKLAQGLLDSGAQAGHRIGIYLGSGADAIIAMLAIMRIGASYVPLDPDLPIERLLRIIEQAEIDTVVCEASSPAQFDRVRRCDPSIARGGAETEELALFDFSSADARAYSVFTSGSTGAPKGIDVRQRNVVALLESMFRALDMLPGQIWSWTHAASFDLSIWEIWGALCSGGCLVVVPRAVRALPEQLWALLQDEGVNIITQTPSGLRQLVPVINSRPSLSDARHWVICGEALTGAVARDMIRDDWEVWNLYGPAETTVFASIQKVDAESAEHAVVPIGKPLDLATLYVLDETATSPAASVGEIVVGGAGVSLGYIGLESLNGERFIQDPYRSAQTAYRTGDLGYWDGQRICFVGRVDEQIKFNGYRIEPAEVERCLERLAPVKQAAVLVEQGEHPRLVALLQWHQGVEPLDERAVRTHLRQYLPDYMQPTRLLHAPSLPLNRHAKLDRSALAGLASELTALSASGVCPSAGWHRRIQDILCDVFERDQVDLDTPYFELGGNSMTLLRMHAQLEAYPEAQHLRPSDLFRLVTGRMLADELQHYGQAEERSVSSSHHRRENVLRHRRANRSVYGGAGNE
ncbi:amino acid adenylation domain-containing protein [Pseudomonas sp. S30]|nr:amino acid adenylation domain-containing protein [Pseudomonas sp. S30]MBJ9975374.1 amino acid adenylation domain-containing protein [Pseudomonas sp. S30]